MRISIRTLANRLVHLDVVREDATIGSLLAMASDREHPSWRPGEFQKVASSARGRAAHCVISSSREASAACPRASGCERVSKPNFPASCECPRACSPSVAQDVVLVHRRTFKRFCNVDQRVSDCDIAEGDVLELTIRFAAQPAVTRLIEPVGFYEVNPRPASTGVPLYSEISVHMVNVGQAIERRPCFALLADVDAEPVPAVQVWKPPNVLTLVPRAPMRANTLYTVTLELALDVVGVLVTGSERFDISCVPDGVDTVRPYQFVWHFQTGSADVGLADNGSSPQAAGTGRSEPSVLDTVHGLLVRPLDGFSKKQLLSLQADMSCMLNRVEGAIRHIDHKIDTINLRLREKAARQHAKPDAAEAGAEQAAIDTLHQQKRARQALNNSSESIVA